MAGALVADTSQRVESGLEVRQARRSENPS